MGLWYDMNIIVQLDNPEHTPRYGNPALRRVQSNMIIATILRNEIQVGYEPHWDVAA